MISNVENDQPLFIRLYSAWISLHKTCHYLENKEKLGAKSKTGQFKRAISEIEAMIDEQKDLDLNEFESQDGPTTLEGMPVHEIIETFNENEESLGKIFGERRHIMDHFNRGNGLDYLTILFRTVTSEQQQKMYTRIRDTFTKNYLEHPIVRESHQ